MPKTKIPTQSETPNHPDAPDRLEIDNTGATPTQLFAVFANERRQLSIVYLETKVGAIPFKDLAEYIALEEGDPTKQQYEQVCSDFQHSHLPRMIDLGLIHYDEDRETVELLVDRSIILPYLELTDWVTLYTTNPFSSSGTRAE